MSLRGDLVLGYDGWITCIELFSHRLVDFVLGMNVSLSPSPVLTPSLLYLLIPLPIFLIQFLW